MQTAIILFKKHIMKLILIIMLIWTVINVLYASQLFAAITFCLLGVPTISTVMGKKYGIPSAILGLLWLLISSRVLLWEFFIK